MDSCEWKMTYNNPNHCSMMELAHTPTRPPWRPAASSITAFKENESAAPRSSFRFKQRSTELAVPPQYMSVTDLIAAMPKRHRVPKPQTLCNSYGLAVEPYSQEQRMTLKTPYNVPYGPVRVHLEADKPEERSSGQKPNSVLEQAAISVASSRSPHSAARGSQLGSPPSGARSLVSSAAPSRAPSVAPSERHHSTAPRHSAITSPAFPMSQPTSPRRIDASSDRASPASGARSVAGSPARSHSSAHRGSRTPRTNSGLPSRLLSENDLSSSHGSTNARSRSSRFNTNTCGSSSRMDTTDANGNKDYPPREMTGGSTPHTAQSRSSRGMSGNSTPSHRSSRDSPPLSGRCSPPTPPTPLSP